jgi:hypothetical protein
MSWMEEEPAKSKLLRGSPVPSTARTPFPGLGQRSEAPVLRISREDPDHISGLYPVGVALQRRGFQEVPVSSGHTVRLNGHSACV